VAAVRTRPRGRWRRRAALLVLAGSWLALCAPPGASAQTPVQPPNDPLFRFQWNLRTIQIPSAWAISRGAGATVAVLDTGVAYENRGRYRQAPDLAGTRFVAGWDFVDDDPYPNDVPAPDGRRSHGTLMAAIIAQTTGNAIGAAGVAPAAAIMPVRVLRPDVTGPERGIARGVRFATDHGADVVNLSLSGRSSTPVLRQAIAYATRKGVTVVAAAGNEGQEAVSWPAADPRVIAVGAVGQDLTRAPYSNFGAALDLVAPGGAGERVDTGHGPSDGVVGQTLKGGLSDFCFCFTASTSAAAAQVSGVAALLVASGRATGPAEVRRALLSSARDLGVPGRDPDHGAGLVQALDALDGGSAASRESADAPASAPGERAATRDSEGISAAWIAAAAVVFAGAIALVGRRFHRRSRM
jgi:serine protease